MPDLDHPDLTAACRKLGQDLTASQLSLLESYAALLREWNRRINLISRQDTERILSYHVVDSLAVSPLIPAHACAADVGSGAGLPGIPLAVARPDIEMLLIESSHKKCLFLETAVRTLGLGNVRVLENRVESLKPLNCSVLLSRLTGPLPQLLKQTRHHLTAGSRLILFKTPNSNIELQRNRRLLERYGLVVVESNDVSLPLTGITRRFILLGRA